MLLILNKTPTKSQFAKDKSKNLQKAMLDIAPKKNCSQKTNQKTADKKQC